MRYIFLLLFLFITKNTSATELSCLFEEVHQTGDTHQGAIIVKDKKFRYQYFSQNLYTIIHKDNLFFYVENRDKTKFFKITKDSDTLKAIVNIINDFPEVEKEYLLTDTIIKVELSKTDKVIKRIIVLSDESNMTVYLKECKNNPIKDIYFSWSPFWDYKY